MSKRTKASELLKDLVNKQVSVITNDGRHIVGRLKGYDNVVNVILEDCAERQYDPDEGTSPQHL